MAITRPGSNEFDPYFGTYVNAVTGEDALEALRRQRASSAELLAGVPESRAGHRYEPGKWTIREVVGHLSDAERVFAYRMLRIGRGDPTPLAGFDENLYVPAGQFERRSLRDVVAEFLVVRDATIALAGSLGEAELGRTGTASGKPVSARALAWIIAGHEAHHVRVLGERYLRR
jgi:hypothetical protein